ncbi:MAG: amino acid transporter substrate-binding protein [Armatimonadetes bacterium]|jgi:osmoprotectant transport system permease protein|nr:amino acid transporter substrate-binding protein [Armatimonadota bacterium]
MTRIPRLARFALALLSGALLLGGGVLPAGAEKPVVIGSKAFAESWILGEALRSLAAEDGAATAEHRSNMGSTDIVYAALKAGKIDVYPEYTGTIAEAILKSTDRPTIEQIRAALAKEGLGISNSLGFNDGYAIAVAGPVAEKLGLTRISDLAAHPELRLAFTHEFLERKDGWPGVARHYGLRLPEVRGIQHDLAYQAIRGGQIDGMEIYTTDAQIARLNLRILEDDRRFFPRYDAVWFYRLDLPQRAPAAFKAMERLVGKIDEAAMIRANALAVVEKRSQEEAATALLRDVLGAPATAALPPAKSSSVVDGIVRDTLTHLRLVGISLLAAALVGIPLGVLAARSRLLGSAVLGITGTLQTIPSLALLAFLIPLLRQIGEVPALVALFLYSLLPIVRNTYTGLVSIPPNLQEAAEALGLSAGSRLLRVQLPLASPSIMAGLKTSAVINVGTATLAAFVGAGGLGEPILRGMQTTNNQLILQGAVPAAVLALAVQGLFDLLDRFVIPRGLRLEREE